MAGKAKTKGRSSRRAHEPEQPPRKRRAPRENAPAPAPMELPPAEQQAAPREEPPELPAAELPDVELPAHELPADEPPAEMSPERHAAASLLDELRAQSMPPEDPAPVVSPFAAPPVVGARVPGSRMRVGSVRWQREQDRRRKAGEPLMPEDGSPAPQSPAAARSAPRPAATPRGDTRAAYAAARGQTGPVLNAPTPEEARRAAGLAAARDPHMVGQLASAIGGTFRTVFDIAAATRGDHWALSEEQAAALGQAWAPVAAYYMTGTDPVVALWAGGLLTTAAVLAPRVVEDRRRATNGARPARPTPPPAPPEDVPNAAPRASASDRQQSPATPPGMVPAGYTS